MAKKEAIKKEVLEGIANTTVASLRTLSKKSQPNKIYVVPNGVDGESVNYFVDYLQGKFNGDNVCVSSNEVRGAYQIHLGLLLR